MSVYKKINIVLLVTAIVVFLSIEWYWKNICSSSDICTFGITEGLLRPIIEGGQGLAIIFAVLLFFPGNLFKRWLQFVFSWAFPLCVLFVASIDIHKTGIFNFDRGVVAWLLAMVFLGVTVLFILGYYLTLWWKKRKGGLMSA